MAGVAQRIRPARVVVNRRSRTTAAWTRGRMGDGQQLGPLPGHGQEGIGEGRRDLPRRLAAGRGSVSRRCPVVPALSCAKR
jgi:hypothetical protein